MDCAKPLILSRLLDGDLSEHEQARWRRHLQFCPPCHTLFQELQAARQTVAAYPLLSPGPYLWQRISRQLNEQAPNIWFSFQELAAGLRPALAALFCVLLVLVSLSVFFGGSPALHPCRTDHLIIEQEQITTGDVMRLLTENREEIFGEIP